MGKRRKKTEQWDQIQTCLRKFHSQSVAFILYAYIPFYCIGLLTLPNSRLKVPSYIHLSLVALFSQYDRGSKQNPWKWKKRNLMKLEKNYEDIIAYSNSVWTCGYWYCMYFSILEFSCSYITWLFNFFFCMRSTRKEISLVGLVVNVEKNLGIYIYMLVNIWRFDFESRYFLELISHKRWIW